MPHQHLCPWWMTWTFDNPLRRLVHHPDRIVAPYVRKGDLAADIGCGMGHFTLGLARTVGPSGRVVAVDLQPQQLAVVNRRAARASVGDRVETRLARTDHLPLPSGIAFALAFWMLHEVPDTDAFLTQVRDALAPGGALLVAEPTVHVSQREFDDEVRRAVALGFVAESTSGIRFSRAVQLRRP